MGIRVLFGVVLSVSLVLTQSAGMALAAENILAPDANATVLIEETKLGGGTDPVLKEYVTLFNAGDTEVSLDGWQLEYAKLLQFGLAPQFCSAPTWNDAIGVTVSVTGLDGIKIPAHGVSSPIVKQLNDTGSGSLRLVDASDPSHPIVHDLVGWGSDAPCKETQPTVTPTSNTSLIRYLACGSQLPIDSDDNSADFAVNQTPAAGTIGSTYKANCNGGTEVMNPEAETTSCQGIILSEVLPNAAGTDTGHEFIELFNPTTDFINLAGCGLQLGPEGQVYHFGDVMLAPGQYQAFSDAETGITLPNSAGGTIYLLSAADEELQAMTYPGDLPDDVAWAWFGGTDWQQTYAPAPNAVNISEPTEPCAEGQVRSNTTGRCQSAEGGADTSTGLKPCEPGQERNPATNRCRSVVTATTACL